MKTILQQAEELGRLIRETDVYRDYRRASELLDEDEEAKKLFDDFIGISKYVRERQELGDIIEKFEIENIKSMSALVSENDVIRNFMDAQQAYLDLILMIQKELEDLGFDEA